jgi:hypothetical protein
MKDADGATGISIARSPRLELVEHGNSHVKLRSVTTGITLEVDVTSDVLALSLFFPDSFLWTLTEEQVRKMLSLEMSPHLGTPGKMLRFRAPHSLQWQSLTEKPVSSPGSG